MSKVTYRPLGNRVIVKPLPETEEDTKIGQFHIADSAIIFQRGEIVAVGKGEVALNTGELIPMETAPGDKVLIRREGAFLPIRYPGDEIEYKLIREGDIECILETSEK